MLPSRANSRQVSGPDEVRKAVLSLDPDRFATDAAAFCNAEYRRASSQAKITPFPQY
jgi:hypothetical protein